MEAILPSSRGERSTRTAETEYRFDCDSKLGQSNNKMKIQDRTGHDRTEHNTVSVNDAIIDSF